MMADAHGGSPGMSRASVSPAAASSSTAWSPRVHALRSAAEAPNHTVDCGTGDGVALFAHPGIMFDLRNTRKDRAQDPEPDTWEGGSKVTPSDSSES